MTTRQTQHIAADDRRAQLCADIRRYRSACGCELGSVFMLSAIAAFGTYIVLGVNDWSVGKCIVYGLIWVVAMSTAGKLIGLSFARVRLHMLRNTLRREFPAT